MATSETARLAAPAPPSDRDEPATWSSRERAAYRAARLEIACLEPGQALLYHEGVLALDAVLDPTIAGRAAAFRDAALVRTEGVLVQRRIRPGWYQYLFLRSSQ